MNTALPGAFRRRSRLRVVLFSGGRGSGALAQQLIKNPAIDLTVAINGYDDGASTGEVRRLLGDCLGPSDFRKNASRLATVLGSAPADLVALLDSRLPDGSDAATVRGLLDRLDPAAGDGAATAALRPRLAAFSSELERSRRSFSFSDCSLGNLVFAGSFLRCGRAFNAAVDDYCGLLGLRPGLVANVTDGTNAYLAALDREGRLLSSEEAVVDARRQNRIDEIFLIARRFDAADEAHVGRLSAGDRRAFLERTAPAAIRANPEVIARLREADLIIYAPGTQHSSLFPSYLTPGLGDAIARNLTAIKLLVTNLHEDAEITGASAVDIIDRALYYLREKGRLTTPTPSLITHYLMNDPGRESPQAYVPLGAVDALEDPRLVRIGNYEDGLTGRHDAEKVLAPFVASLLGSDREPAVAVYLHDAESPNKLAETLLEMVRGGVADLPLTLTVFHSGAAVDEGLAGSLPFPVRHVPAPQVLDALRHGGFEYVVLFESSGMYRGEDVVALASPLAFVRLDAVWGSRRLSSRDVDAAVRLVYRHNWLLGMASRAGSHVLSVLYLVLFGRYISDTLSGARAVRARTLFDLRVDPSHKLANHQLLSGLLRDRGEILEIPVRFLPISPERVKRTSMFDGLRAIAEVVARRFGSRPARTSPQRPAEMSSAEKTVTVGKT